MIGRQVDRFRIVGRLGQGGMGSVWKAEDTLLHRPVALKLLSEEWTHSPEARSRFLREARAASALSHPGVATVFGAGETDGVVYIALALIDGETVSDLAARRPLEPGDVVRLGLAVAEALAHAHSRGVIHRDITSRNIMVDRDGRVFVLDFGLAMMTDRTRLTTSVSTMGTAAYMAPEVILGNDADPRADLYGLGVVLYEALTGALPFASERPEGLLYAAVHDVPVAPGARREGVPAWLDAVIVRLLAKSPDERFAGADALIDALRAGASLDAGVRLEHAVVESASERAEAAPVRANAVVVARLRAPGTTPADLSLADGLTDGLHAALAGLSGIELLPLPESAPAEDAAGLRQQARRLGARFALSGSVRRTGEQLRVAWSLTEVTSGALAAGETLTGAAGDPFELEDRLIEGVRAALRAAAGARGGAARSDDREAHRSFLDALSRLRRSDSEAGIDEAIGLLEGLRERRGDTASVHAALGRAYLKKYQLRTDRALAVKAAEACHRAIALDPHAADVFVTLGDLHVATGRHDEATEAFRQALDLRAEHPDALAGLALAAIRSGRFEEAEDASRRLVAARPDDWLGYNRLGTVFYRQGRYALAIEPWKMVTKLSPDNAAGHSNLGSAYHVTGRLEEALAAFERSVAVADTPGGHGGLGTVLFYMGRFEASAAAFEHAVRLLPSDPSLWGNLANACDEVPGLEARAAEARDRAIALMLERLELNPNDAEDWLELGSWRADRGQFGPAREATERALALAPADLSVRARAGVCFEMSGDRARALALFAEARAGGYAIEVLASNPSLAALREDPRFQALLQDGTAERAGSEQSNAQNGGRE